MSVPLPPPIRRMFDQCDIGFTLPRKIGITLVALVYIVSPLDVLPDPLLPPLTLIDDVTAVVLMFRVWCSPTL